MEAEQTEEGIGRRDNKQKNGKEKRQNWGHRKPCPQFSHISDKYILCCLVLRAIIKNSRRLSYETNNPTSPLGSQRLVLEGGEVFPAGSPNPYSLSACHPPPQWHRVGSGQALQRKLQNDSEQLLRTFSASESSCRVGLGHY